MLFPKLVRLADPEPHSAVLNMAIDEELLRTATTPTLRHYRWTHRAVSFGYFAKYADVERAWPTLEPVRRWTGGGIVLHGDDFTYSLVVPHHCPFFKVRPQDSYRAVHERIARALGMGSESLAPDPAPKISGACFENAARHDLVVGATKIAGAAQRRTRSGLLHQGSIQLPHLPLHFPQRLATALGEEIVESMLADELIAAAQSLATQRYSTPSWLRRV